MRQRLLAVSDPFSVAPVWQRLTLLLMGGGQARVTARSRQAASGLVGHFVQQPIPRPLPSIFYQGPMAVQICCPLGRQGVCAHTTINASARISVCTKDDLLRLWRLGWRGLCPLHPQDTDEVR